MMSYAMTLIAAGKEIIIPVLPSKLKVASSGDNETDTVLGQLFPGSQRPICP